MNKVAIVVPHGDDEALGFGGVIQKHIAQKDEVSVVFCRAPIDCRTQKQFNDIEKAKEVLGYKNVHYLYVTEKEISNEPLHLFRKIEGQLNSIQPDIVYTTFWGDIHQDHKITFDCVVRAVRVWGLLKVKKFYVGEIPSSTDQYPTIAGTSFSPNFYVPLTKEQVLKKIEALYAYKGETNEYPHPRSEKGISTKAAIRGQECGTEFAEAFMCLRFIDKE
jgi:LmbE family N-acetylglucosaminyl deacetylase